MRDENVGETPEAKVLAAGETPADQKIKDVMRAKGLPLLFKGVAVFEKELAAGGPGGEGDAPKPKPGADGAGAGASSASASEGNAAKELRSDKTAPLSRKAHTIKMTERFYCRPVDICEALLDQNRVMHFSRSPASVRPGARALLHVRREHHGRDRRVRARVKIVQRWRFRNWAEGHHSVVTITFREPEPGNTFVDLVQTEVPEADGFGNESVMDTTEIGWKEQIFNRIRQAFGYGA